jgi:hypothetical protein
VCSRALWREARWVGGMGKWGLGWPRARALAMAFPAFLAAFPVAFPAFPMAFSTLPAPLAFPACPACPNLRLSRSLCLLTGFRGWAFLRRVPPVAAARPPRRCIGGLRQCMGTEVAQAV